MIRLRMESCHPVVTKLKALDSCWTCLISLLTFPSDK
jgi:hypothetical protein